MKICKRPARNISTQPAVQADVGPCFGGGYAAGVYALRQLITLALVGLQQRGPRDQDTMQIHRDG